MANLVGKVTGLVKTSITQAKPVLNVWQQYARVELTPPTLRDIPEIRNGFSKLINSARTGRYREVTVREAIVNTLVAAEIYCWFFVGECIGKRHFVGYDV
ncbi:ATP synthase subunit g, mitochondrial [Pseudomyrmex gracilis]|uniref:ATP synthase subunit g, mitochondrial n=1 Tax=Pseudomyrmex gracilis TaxID=219809 RepID=UPI00099541C2|nr:ATP synthase subunit g, mitochondrial [Pseudomyrmex gracilis]